MNTTTTQPILHPSGAGTTIWHIHTRFGRLIAKGSLAVRIVVVPTGHGAEQFCRYTPSRQTSSALTQLESGDVTERFGPLHLLFERTDTADRATGSQTTLRLGQAHLFGLELPKMLLDIDVFMTSTDRGTHSTVDVGIARLLTLTYSTQLIEGA